MQHLTLVNMCCYCVQLVLLSLYAWSTCILILYSWCSCSSLTLWCGYASLEQHLRSKATPNCPGVKRFSTDKHGNEQLSTSCLKKSHNTTTQSDTMSVLKNTDKQ